MVWCDLICALEKFSVERFKPNKYFMQIKCIDRFSWRVDSFIGAIDANEPKQNNLIKIR